MQYPNMKCYTEQNHHLHINETVPMSTPEPPKQLSSSAIKRFRLLCLHNLLSLPRWFVRSLAHSYLGMSFLIYVFSI